MNYKRYFYGGGWVIGLLFSKMVLAQTLVINLYDVNGQGIDVNNVQINNILIDTLVKNPINGILEMIKVPYSFVFRACQSDPANPNSLYLEPWLTGQEPPCYMSSLDFIDAQVFGGMNDINGIPLPNRVQVNNVHDYTEKSTVASLYSVVFELNLEKLRLEQIDKYPSPPPNLSVGISSLSPSFPIMIVLSWGGNGRVDFDAHLTGPAPNLPPSYNNEFGRFHVYFGNKNYESIRLDTDDFSNSQPEIIEIFPPPGQDKLRPGVYRYSVHRFQGNDDFVEARVQVHLLIDNQEQVFEPQLFAEDNKYRNNTMMLTWEVFELIVDENGMIQVQPQQHYYASNPPEVRRKNQLN